MKQIATSKKRYTLVLHTLIGGGGDWRIIEFKRIYCNEAILQQKISKMDVHFIVAGWPEVRFPNGSDCYAEYGKAKDLKLLNIALCPH